MAINIFLFAKINSLIYKTASGIRHYTPKLHVRDLLSIKGLLYSVQKAGTDNASATVVDKNLGSAKSFNTLSGLILSIFTEYKTSR